MATNNNNVITCFKYTVTEDIKRVILNVLEDFGVKGVASDIGFYLNVFDGFLSKDFFEDRSNLYYGTNIAVELVDNFQETGESLVLTFDCQPIEDKFLELYQSVTEESRDLFYKDEFTYAIVLVPLVDDIDVHKLGQITAKLISSLKDEAISFSFDDTTYEDVNDIDRILDCADIVI